MMTEADLTRIRESLEVSAPDEPLPAWLRPIPRAQMDYLEALELAALDPPRHLERCYTIDG